MTQEEIVCFPHLNLGCAQSRSSADVSANLGVYQEANALGVFRDDDNELVFGGGRMLAVGNMEDIPDVRHGTLFVI